LNAHSRDEKLTLVFIYSGEYAERVVRNLINDPSFCKSCGIYCDTCKYNVYSHVQSVRAAIELPKPSDLPSFIDEPVTYLPKKIPEANLCVASGLHKDLLLEVPNLIEKAAIGGLIVPIEDFTEVPSGLCRQVAGLCSELGLESAFPKPFCSLDEVKDKPLITRFVQELKVGRPLLDISTAKAGRREAITSVKVKRSAPCGSTWYIAKKLMGVETENEILYDSIARAHHSYPCTATMSMDPDTREPILHMGGYIIREEVEKALEIRRESKIR